MAQIIGDWKRFHAKRNGVVWQENFFDHRIRTEKEFEDKFQYMERNPVVKGLCESCSEWPWRTVETEVLPKF